MLMALEISCIYSGLELRPGMPGISPELVVRIPGTGMPDYIPGGDNNNNNELL